MLRVALPVLMLAACAPDTAGPQALPDADIGCSIGTFQIKAPVEGLHYDPALDVYIDEAELQGELTLTMIDDAGTSYQSTSDTYGPDPTDSFLTLDKYVYALAPSHRYDLTVSHCTTSQTVTFFTSP